MKTFKKFKVFQRKINFYLYLSLSILLSLFMLTGCTSMDNFSKKLGYSKVYTEIIIQAEPEEVWAVSQTHQITKIGTL